MVWVTGCIFCMADCVACKNTDEEEGRDKKGRCEHSVAASLGLNISRDRAVRFIIDEPWPLDPTNTPLQLERESAHTHTCNICLSA